jgi:hypothetical protein
MLTPRRHTHILPIPAAASLDGARLEAFYTEAHARHEDAVLDYWEQVPAAPPRLFMDAGQLYAAASGLAYPHRLRFCGVDRLKCTGLYTHLADVPFDSDARLLKGAFYFLSTEGQRYFILYDNAPEPTDLVIVSWRQLPAPRRLLQEPRPGDPRPFDVVQPWLCPPPFRPALVPAPRRLHQRFAGDPLPIQLHGRLHNRQLFIGAIAMQGPVRPQVDAVLNLGEDPNPWAAGGQMPPSDRWENQGEGRAGMDLPTITAYAQWVLERLQRGQRVLVHCQAGMNRSVTICCAVLILLEGLSAEAALARVRQTHPWARPDTYHWLRLKWLAAEC